MFNETDVLRCLDNANLILASFCLNRNHKMTTMLINTHIKFIDFDLTDTFHRRTKMVLQAVGR